MRRSPAVVSVQEQHSPAVRRSRLRLTVLAVLLLFGAGCDDGDAELDSAVVDMAPMADGTPPDGAASDSALEDAEADDSALDDAAADAGILDRGPAPEVRTPTPVIVGEEAVELFVQFGATEVVNGAGQRQKIWTRGYGLEDGTSMIPGPTFHFQPGDLLQITLNNLLSAERLQTLVDFEGLEAANESGMSDELIDARGEVNVPHNADNTNLHTHGLHVDPNIDDVTLIVTPEGDSAANYDPSIQHLIREQIQAYRYRIPALHLPGTHWYHAHKHGSTATHVENGMAGALIIRPQDDANAIVPGLPTDDDRVFHLQMINNFAVQQGAGMGGGGEFSQGSSFVAVNGDNQPVLRLRPGQVQRWRFINSAANHQSFTYLWLGRETGEMDGDKAVVVQVPMHLVAIDGVTLKRSIPITADRPIFMGPGNRADVVLALPEGTFRLYKNYPKDVSVRDAAGMPVAARPTAGPNSNPYLFAEIDGQPGFAGQTVAWSSVEADGTPTGMTDDCTNRDRDGNITSRVDAPCTPIIPLIRLTSVDAEDGSTLADVTYATDFPNGLWQPLPRGEIGGGGGGQASAQLMMTVVVDGAPSDGPAFDQANLDAQLARISPTGANADNVPGYVSLLANADILQSRAATFDISGVSAVVPKKGVEADCNNRMDFRDKEKCLRVRQFTLNGRQFDVADSIGNAEGLQRIAEPPTEPAGIFIDYIDRAKRWINGYWTNPGYYSAVEILPDAVDSGGSEQPVYYYAPTNATPDVGAITGLPDEAIVNPASRFAPAANTPGLPVATSGEQWVLINNSAVGHPFHIHINPFFVTEVGQLSYETFANGKSWAVRTINPDPDGMPEDPGGLPVPDGVMKLRGTSDLWWVPNNWWDTIVVPPHGYVKMRYWMNVPEQSREADLIQDNANRSGSWVYHCHILRHEDRGMMMVVETQPKQDP